MSMNELQRAAENLSIGAPQAERLAVAYETLEVVESVIQELSFLVRSEPPPDWEALRENCGRARIALLRTRTIRLPLASPPPTVAFSVDEVPVALEALMELTGTLVVMFMEVANFADFVMDEPCCLEAALRINDLRRALLPLQDSTVGNSDEQRANQLSSSDDDMHQQ
ncbi:hypothetical protein [Spirillospora sp. NPDC047279]|uniref:hypothetical protein n=1 Tax=Spirillospora sp. NPDC047279 TaxID=3155478 RepID=UPI0033C6FCD7